MFGLSKLILDKCDQIKTMVDSDTVETSYVLYTGKGEKIEMGKKVVKVSVIDSKIAELQAEKTSISNLTKEVVEQVEVK